MSKAELRRTWKEDGFECAIFEHLMAFMDYYTAYIGVPEEHVAVTVGASNYERLPLNVHGGITYSRNYLSDVDPDGEKEVFWIGWDYAHSFSDEMEIDEVIEEVRDVVDQLKHLSIDDCVRRFLEYKPDWVRENVRIDTDE